MVVLYGIHVCMVVNTMLVGLGRYLEESPYVNYTVLSYIDL